MSGFIVLVNWKGCVVTRATRELFYFVISSIFQLSLKVKLVHNRCVIILLLHAINSYFLRHQHQFVYFYNITRTLECNKFVSQSLSIAWFKTKGNTKAFACAFTCHNLKLPIIYLEVLNLVSFVTAYFHLLEVFWGCAKHKRANFWRIAKYIFSLLNSIKSVEI